MRVLTTLLLLAATLEAQVTWTAAPLMAGRSSHAMAYDAARDRVVVFSGLNAQRLADTWEWDGGRWRQMQPTTSPSFRSGHAMAYDPGRRRVVLFGGSDRSDTWEWDGTNWLQRIPRNSPPGRRGHALAYDTARRRLVLFGGTRGSHSHSRVWYSDTWEWDGTDWQQRTPTTNPPGRAEHSLAYDAARQRVVLYGGSAPPFSRTQGDTWEWDGSNWLRRFPSNTPPALANHTLVFDPARRRTVLFGGRDINSFSDTWEWDGQTWALRFTTSRPPARFDHGATFDSLRQRMLVFGGSTSTGQSADTWLWDGSRWSTAPLSSPPARIRSAMAYDSARQRTVLFGGLDRTYYGDTWEWDGRAWALQSPTTRPPARCCHALAYDAARGRVVLFGGFGSSGKLSDTWEYDGTTWIRRNPTTRPSARERHAMAYDAARRRVVLFGGLGFLADTWEWDGTRWIQIRPAKSPPGRAGLALAYDALRRRIVLFGGTAPRLGGSFADTWEFDGINWVQRFPQTSPPRRAEHGLCFDTRRGCTVLFGGFPFLADTWEWDGTNWQQQSMPVPPVARSRHALAYDSGRGRAVLFGGTGGFGNFSDTWEYHSRALIQGSGTARPGGTVTLSLSSPGDGGRTYQVASSLGPGPIVLGNRKLPLTPDLVFEVSIGGSAPGVFAKYSGVLDPRGAAQATINIPRLNSLIGLSIYSAFVTLKNTAPFGLQSVSNHDQVTIR